jgi:hypothetical protein
MTARAVRAKAAGALTGDEFLAPNSRLLLRYPQGSEEERLILRQPATPSARADELVLPPGREPGAVPDKTVRIFKLPTTMGRKPHQLIWQWNCSWFQGERAWPVQSNSAGL